MEGTQSTYMLQGQKQKPNPHENYEVLVSNLTELLVEYCDLVTRIENLLVNQTSDEEHAPSGVIPDVPTVENCIQRAIDEARKNNRRLNGLSEKLAAALGSLKIYTE